MKLSIAAIAFLIVVLTLTVTRIKLLASYNVKHFYIYSCLMYVSFLHEVECSVFLIFKEPCYRSRTSSSDQLHKKRIDE